MRKGKLVAVLSAGLLAVSALGGTAFAHWGGVNSDAVYEKIAEELGTDSATVSEAYATASDEARDAAIAEKLARLVENEVLTQEESDAIQAWYDSAPEAMGKLPIGRGIARADLERVAEILGVDLEALTEASASARDAVAVEEYQARLDEAVVDGRITQEQADEMLARFQERVEAGHGVGKGFGGHGFGPHGRGHHHGMRGFGPGFGWDVVPGSEDTTTETTTDSTTGEAA